MKIIILISFLFALSFANLIQSNSLALIEDEKKYTFDTITSAKKDFLLDGDSIYKFSDKIVWSHFTITNLSSDSQSLIVRNAIRLLRHADALVIHEDGSKEVFTVGTDRKNSYSNLGVVGYPLVLKPNESVEIYTRHDSDGLLNTHWNISDVDQFYYNKLIENSLIGIIFGVVFLILIYGFILFYITREMSNLYFNGLMIIRVFVILSITSFFYTFNYEIGQFIRQTINTYIPMLMFFEAIFLISLYNLKEKSPLFYRIFSFVALFGIFFVLVAIYKIFTAPSIIVVKSMMLYMVVSALISLSFSIYAMYHIWKGATYLLISIIAFIYARYSYMSSNEFMSTLLIVTTIETLLIFATLTLKVQEIYEEKIKAQKIILEHAKYLSLGKMLAATIHQLRTPIAHIGAIATKISFVFEHHKDQLDKEEYNSSHELEHIVSMANNTLSDLYNLYSTDQQKEYFDLKEAIGEILLLMNTKSDNHSISMILSLVSAPVFNYPNSFKHIIMIIMENAIDILQEREIKNPTIHITLSKSESGYEIHICDNGEGVKIKPIEDVFEMYKSDKKTKGLGLGLALAKDLSNFMGAQLDVFNTEDGACFRLRTY